ncbi:ArsR family transcriptional regulator [Rhizocola hellebori]|uniref:ArsR family transcriptional regulator n=1 Tax=Rhizocola hellebori TaxID=1392758 RepID=A0A8J3QA46_9ACTN|nr:helix-turn-helix domain-containing protein [Rhizocola hellebori]GIH05963.1 ArsR family transcriptional regulator [Rhizocola hellebori]
MSEEQVTAIAALGDATRRQVYQVVVGHGGVLSRDEVAAQLGIGRTLAAFHLDKLVEAGLLETSFARGPHGGRPAKLYCRSGAEVAVSLPPRSYVDAAELLAEAVEKAGADHTLHRVARKRGLALKQPDMWEALRERGYEPFADGGVTKLRNCPFHALAQEFPPLVCGMNLALLKGMAEGSGWPVEPKMAPQAGQCCVVLEDK